MDVDDYLPLSGLSELLYCERRAGLRFSEGIWLDNAFTVWGTQLHERVDLPGTSTELGVKVAYALPLRCNRLRLTGKADVIELHPDASYAGGFRPFPIEYKHGNKHRWLNNDVQVCAQALCLEEMMGVEIPRGALYYAGSKRRMDVEFTPLLRQQTESAARRLHEIVASGVTPTARYGPRCDDCSLLAVCLPKQIADPHGASAYLDELFKSGERGEK